MNRRQWESLIRHAQQDNAVEALIATIPGARKWHGNMRPRLMACGENEDKYMIKGRLTDTDVTRALIADHITGLAGNLLSAPVPKIVLVNVSMEMIDKNPVMQHFLPGFFHGSKQVPDCVNYFALRDHVKDDNRQRLSSLAILFGWFCGGDQQFIHQKNAPYLVYSVDHCHFFPNGPNWTIGDLQNADDPIPDRDICNQCDITDSELLFAARPLVEIDESGIAELVAAPPDEWNFPLDQRVEVAMFLERRRKRMVEHFFATMRVN